uniref:Glutathione-dependent formaldehyde-activating GFA n=1 Tax=Caulobacter sp. (strain K31) TaxID=366602 RepID=B0T247_CAUSK
MDEEGKLYTGGCLCGALRYEARGEPLFMGHCYCADCRKASGSGFIPFMAFSADGLTFSAPTRTFVCTSARGGDAVRNSCPVCASLVFGGPVGETDSHTIYAGSLDDPSAFRPTVAIFTKGRPDWAVIPEGLTAFDGLPD